MMTVVCVSCLGVSSSWFVFCWIPLFVRGCDILRIVTVFNLAVNLAAMSALSVCTENESVLVFLGDDRCDGKRD